MSTFAKSRTELGRRCSHSLLLPPFLIVERSRFFPSGVSRRSRTIAFAFTSFNFQLCRFLKCRDDSRFSLLIAVNNSSIFDVADGRERGPKRSSLPLILVPPSERRFAENILNYLGSPSAVNMRDRACVADALSRGTISPSHFYHVRVDPSPVFSSYGLCAPPVLHPCWIDAN